MTLHEEIRALAAERQALILAHNYTLPEVQDVADFVGDSLELSRKAASCQARTIVFCGVRFMAETAKILSPNATVLLPNAQAGCPMADMASAPELRAWRKDHPEALVLAYVNTTAETKTEVDICCTSGNARRILESLPADREILFVPDRNLGANLMRETGRKLTLWQGCCPTHAHLMPATVTAARAEHPEAEVLVHPECRPEVVALADHALSTGGMLSHVRASAHKVFLIGTEMGLLHRLRKENPDKTFYPLEPRILCPNMKRTTLEDVLFALRDNAPQIVLEQDVMDRARASITAMLERC